MNGSRASAVNLCINIMSSTSRPEHLCINDMNRTSRPEYLCINSMSSTSRPEHLRINYMSSTSRHEQAAFWGMLDGAWGIHGAFRLRPAAVPKNCPSWTLLSVLYEASSAQAGQACLAAGAGHNHAS